MKPVMKGIRGRVWSFCAGKVNHQTSTLAWITTESCLIFEDDSKESQVRDSIWNQTEEDANAVYQP